MILAWTGRLEVAVDVRFGSKADICSAQTNVRFTPNSDRESGHHHGFMSALPPKADICTSSCLLRANSGHSTSHETRVSRKVLLPVSKIARRHQNHWKRDAH